MPNRLIEETSPYLLQHANNPVDWYTWKPEALHQATRNLLESYDWAMGGWGNAPRFPQPMAIEFLLMQATRGNENALAATSHALEKMNQGGMYDVVGGGFHRYSTDNHWLVPHFENMTGIKNYTP